MRVLLIQSFLGGKEPPVYPLGLACLKAQLKDHEVRAFDMNVSDDPFNALKREVESFRPEAIGISLRNIDSTNKREVVFYYEYLKKTVDLIRPLTDARLIIGGSGFSMYAKEIMADEPRLDYGVFLEGEFIFPKLLENLDGPEKVNGVFYRKSGRVAFSGGGGQVDLNTVAIPARDFTPMEKYRDVPEAIGIETKRGCALKCIYCIYGFLNGSKYRLRDPKMIVDEVEALVGKYGAKRFTFVDSVFNIPIKHAEAICREMISRKVKAEWSAWFSEREITTEFIDLAVEAGCRKVILSPDGFSDAVLKALQKNLTKKDITDAFKVLSSKEGYEVSYNFFKNPPGQSLGAFVSLALFCLRARLKMGKRVHFEFNSMRVEPHTKLFEIALKDGFVTKDDNLLHPKYYTNPGTKYIEDAFNFALKLKGK